MLTTILFWLGGAVGVVMVLVAWLYYRTVAGARRAFRELAARIEPVTQALANGQIPAQADLVRFAQDRETRKVLFAALEGAGRADLFPAEWRTWEHMAEADLVAWLNHPNELGCPPAAIELVARVPDPGAATDHAFYFVFRYRTLEPHWQAKAGWMAGVSGPYDTAAPPVPHARGTFSRFEAFDSRTPEQHVAVVHDAVFGNPRARVPAA